MMNFFRNHLFKKRSFKLLLFLGVIPIIIFLIIFIIRNQYTIKIDPTNDEFYFFIGSDSESGGNSVIHNNEKNKNYISFTYELKHGVEYPYAHLEIRKKNVFDLSKYDSLSLKVKSEKSKTLILSFYTFIDNYTDFDDFSTYLPLTFVLPLKENAMTYEIDLDKFKIPDWWLLDNKIDKKNVNNVLFKKIIYMSLTSNPLFPMDEIDKVTFYNLNFYTNKNNIMIFSIKVISFYYLILLILILLKIIKYKKEQFKLIRYNAVNTLKKSTRIDDLEKYIGLNFSNPTLNLTSVSEELNLTERKISNEIKTKYNLTFPAYLNLIRINEAKGLLTETDHKILDIALAVGYNNVSHFNRIFKKIENINPTNYRKEHFKL